MDSRAGALPAPAEGLGLNPGIPLPPLGASVSPSLKETGYEPSTPGTLKKSHSAPSGLQAFTGATGEDVRADSRDSSQHPASRAPGTLSPCGARRGETPVLGGDGVQVALQRSGLKRASGPSPAAHDDGFYAPCTDPSLTCKESDSC